MSGSATFPVECGIVFGAAVRPVYGEEDQFLAAVGGFRRPPVRSVNTTVELGGLSIPPRQPQVMMGAVAFGLNDVGDGQGGLFFWSYTSTAIVDNINYFASSDPNYAVAGRWIRVDATTPVETTATPSFTPAAGPFSVPFSLVMACTTPASSIWWTNNGATPVPGVSTEYTAPILTNTSTTYKAIASSGLGNSPIRTGVYTLVASLPVYWGFSPSTTLNEAGILALQNTSNESDAFRNFTFQAGSTEDDYYFFSFPAAFASPAAGNGFFYISSPVSMAGTADGYTDGPVNGWYFTNVTVGGIAHHLYRSFQQLGGGGPDTLTVQ